MPKPSFLKRQLKSFQNAFKGLFILLRTETNFKIQFGIAVLVTVAGVYFDISSVEWALQWICIGMVMGAEGLNTAIEKLADYTQPNYDKKIGVVKDISAGAVILLAIIAIIVGLIIYVPKVT